MNLVRFGNNYFIIEMHSAFVFIIFETIFAFKIIDNIIFIVKIRTEKHDEIRMFPSDFYMQLK